MKCIAHRYWSKSCPVLYVSDLKGVKGDWGYTTSSREALPLTEKQQKQFLSYCKSVGVVPVFIPAN